MIYSVYVEMAGVFVAIVVVLVGLWRYLDGRDREHRWRKTEFIFKEASKLDDNVGVSNFMMLLENKSGDKVSELISDSGIWIGKAEQYQAAHQVFNLLDRLEFAYTSSQSISIAELEPFYWYFTIISRDKTVRKYLEKSGYKSVLSLSKEIELILKENSKN